MAMAVRGAITGIGAAVPDRVMTNFEFEKFLDTSDEWIQVRTGIAKRQYAAPDQATSDLAVPAASQAIANAGLEPTDIDYLVVATMTPDYFFLSEDMAYKAFSLISPAMIREFILPAYHEWGAIIRGAGVPIYDIDSDGFIGEIIPIWMEAGVNLCDNATLKIGVENLTDRKYRAAHSRMDAPGIDFLATLEITF